MTWMTDCIWTVILELTKDKDAASKEMTILSGASPIAAHWLTSDTK